MAVPPWGLQLHILRILLIPRASFTGYDALPAKRLPPPHHRLQAASAYSRSGSTAQNARALIADWSASTEFGQSWTCSAADEGRAATTSSRAVSVVQLFSTVLINMAVCGVVIHSREEGKSWPGGTEKTELSARDGSGSASREQRRKWRALGWGLPTWHYWRRRGKVAVQAQARWATVSPSGREFQTTKWEGVWLWGSGHGNRGSSPTSGRVLYSRLVSLEQSKSCLFLIVDQRNLLLERSNRG